MTFGGLDSLFNPAKQHMEEEKLRLQSTREEVGDASGGRRIDLDSGRVRLAGRAEDADADEDAADDAVIDAKPSEVKAESGAARRARERRSKTAK